MIWSFGSYQTNIELFYSRWGCSVVFITRKEILNDLFLLCLKVVLPFLGAFIINQIIVKTFFSLQQHT